MPQIRHLWMSWIAGKLCNSDCPNHCWSEGQVFDKFQVLVKTQSGGLQITSQSLRSWLHEILQTCCRFVFTFHKYSSSNIVNDGISAQYQFLMDFFRSRTIPLSYSFFSYVHIGTAWPNSACIPLTPSIFSMKPLVALVQSSARSKKKLALLLLLQN